MNSNIPADALHDPNAPFNQEERETSEVGILVYEYETGEPVNRIVTVYSDEIPSFLDELEGLINRYNVEK